MLTQIDIRNICNREIEYIQNNISLLLESAYKWQSESYADYNLFRFSNALFYNARKHLGIIEKESRDMFIRILKNLFREPNSGYSFDDNLKLKDSALSFIVWSDVIDRTAFCFKTKIEGEDWVSLKESEGFEKLNVVFLSTDYALPFTERYEKEGISKRIYIGDGLFDLFDDYFGKGSSDIVRELLRNYILDTRSRLGIIAIDTTSDTKTYNLKLRIREYIQKTDFSRQGFWKIEEKKDKDGLNVYQVSMTPSNEIGIDDESKESIRRQFYEEKYYEIMLGNSEFANSLLTSEWLYHSFQNKTISCSEKYDFTPVICGYLKSMEQLIFLLMKCLVNKGYYAQAAWDTNLFENLKKNRIRYESRPVSKKTYTDILLLDKSLEFVDTQLGALIIFLKQPTSHSPVLNTSTDVICELLDEFRKECRNGYFHTDNVYSWEIVEKVRNNAYLLYFLLLGDCCNVSLDNSKLGIVFQSKFEAFCKKIGPFFSSGKKVVMVNNGEEKEIDIDVDEKPIYENGTRLYRRILVAYYEKMDSSDRIGYLSDPFYLTEDTMPDEIYTVDLATNEKEIVWKK